MRSINGKPTFVHRHIMEEHLGRELLRHETVHHKNLTRTDNRLKNLELRASIHPRGASIGDLVEFALEVLALYS